MTPIHVDSHGNILKRFIEIARKAQDTKDFMSKASEIDATHNEQQVFKQRYGHLSMYQASEKFMHEVETETLYVTDL